MNITDKIDKFMWLSVFNWIYALSKTGEEFNNEYHTFTTTRIRINRELENEFKRKK